MKPTQSSHIINPHTTTNHRSARTVCPAVTSTSRHTLICNTSNNKQHYFWWDPDTVDLCPACVINTNNEYEKTQNDVSISICESESKLPKNSRDFTMSSVQNAHYQKPSLHLNTPNLNIISFVTLSYSLLTSSSPSALWNFQPPCNYHRQYPSVWIINFRGQPPSYVPGDSFWFTSEGLNLHSSSCHITSSF